MMGERYIEIPGSETHELPPLMVHVASERIGDFDSVMLAAEDMLAVTNAGVEVLERRKLDLALQLTEHYRGFVSQWFLGDGVLEWIRQCEITFEHEGVLRKLLHPDIWPHASRASFVKLLAEKGVRGGGDALEKAVGLRLTFRQPPPIDCFSSEFLFCLNSTVADSAYTAWSHLAPRDSALFPPERFHFDVLEMN